VGQGAHTEPEAGTDALPAELLDLWLGSAPAEPIFTQLRSLRDRVHETTFSNKKVSMSDVLNQ
jgi:hypothetical protein